VAAESDPKSATLISSTTEFRHQMNQAQVAINPSSLGEYRAGITFCFGSFS
jgi:hypothetical protein